jgi:hypothetical protein
VRIARTVEAIDAAGTGLPVATCAAFLAAVRLTEPNAGIEIHEDTPAGVSATFTNGATAHLSFTGDGLCTEITGQNRDGNQLWAILPDGDITSAQSAADEVEIPTGGQREIVPSATLTEILTPRSRDLLKL